MNHRPSPEAHGLGVVHDRVEHLDAHFGLEDLGDELLDPNPERGVLLQDHRRLPAHLLPEDVLAEIDVQGAERVVAGDVHGVHLVRLVLLHDLVDDPDGGSAGDENEVARAGAAGVGDDGGRFEGLPIGIDVVRHQRLHADELSGLDGGRHPARNPCDPHQKFRR